MHPHNPQTGVGPDPLRVCGYSFNRTLKHGGAGPTQVLRRASAQEGGDHSLDFAAATEQSSIQVLAGQKIQTNHPLLYTFPVKGLSVYTDYYFNVC